MQLFWNEEQEPLDEIKYWVPGTRKKFDDMRPLDAQYLPIFHAQADTLPEALDALIICSDLQGHVKIGDELILLGEWLPTYLKAFLSTKFPDIDPKCVGIGLCGDMYASPAKRGGAGDVRQVWAAFLKQFRWVAGVAGNHDLYGDNEQDLEDFRRLPGIHFLDGQVIEVDGLLLGGVSGIVGEKNKPFRVPELLYFKRLEKVLSKSPDFLFLHESPSAEGMHGNPDIAEVLEKKTEGTLFCGHCHWRKVQVVYEKGFTVYNLDARVLLITRI